eukprot:TRINITY_DN8470_c0_g2_i4.p1 TRINITY_DN8470_c0_g2~~TRINITY_DN8470_c0_g2_i4.p1  ORF type:complete len:295 (+),score=47.95 TRINITY_DN8470_c0_g2_i4:56-940(+)
MARVLSIQSHVVSGYVGNKSATFPLQVLGFEVDAVNSVQFSNHTGYGQWTGTKLTADDLWQLYLGLEKNQLISDYSHVLTGYVGSGDFLSTLGKMVTKLKSVNQSLKYVCDPVLGDNGKLYVPEELVAMYKQEIVPLADIMTPNQFELELLTDSKIASVDDAWTAMASLHDRGVQAVVLTSLDTSDGRIHILGSEMQEGRRHRFTLQVPKIEFYFTGTGDLFSALILAWSNQQDSTLSEAVHKATASLQAVCKRTCESCASATPSFRERELKLVASKSDIEHPDTSIVQLTIVT